ncbi:MAG: biopolymer transporter ExbD [Candidatus Omnitrophica bacterium]|nr:biopolymer transporter ExbD [Candidatus Omnitrophota bacterium]MCF7887715.1 biopolymer transporter ExbD [Candidatus Omnitrophota bacterium]
MKFKRESKINAGLKQMDIVPLVDCVFLLLIFFMLSSSFVAVPGINIKLPKAISSQTIDTRPLTLIVSSEDIIYLNGDPCSTKEIENYLRQKEIKSIFIKADKGASLETIVTIWDICKNLKINRIGIATTNSEQ